VVPLLQALLLALLAAHPGAGDEELERARKLLADTKEESCWDGTDLCVAENSVPAVELLLDVLRQEADRGLPIAHYRDVVWGGLVRVTGREARERVRTELEKNKKDPLVRQWCAECLGEFGDPESAMRLVPALDDRDLGVRRASARALGKLRFSSPTERVTQALKNLAATVLDKKTGDKDPILRANAIESVARLYPEDFRATLMKGLADKDAGVRCALLGAAAELYPEQGEELAAAALADPDWRPRLQAVDVLGEVKATSALRRLIDALGDARPVVVARAARHLQELTGEKHTKKEAWEFWWKEKGDGFDFSRGRRKEARTADETVAGSFNGILFESDHVAFLIDVSQRMAQPLVSQQCSRAEAAVKELEATLTRLQGQLNFSLYTYANGVTPFSKKGPVELTPKVQEKALEFVRDEPLLGSKDIWGALEVVLEDPDVDTVFLLSSGEPDIGLYVHWNRVTWHLRELNRFHKLVVHAIAYDKEEGYRDQLRKIAEATGGEFKGFE
jgi:hypothetical protein